MAFRAEKSPLHPGIYVLVGVFMGSLLSSFGAGAYTTWIVGLSLVGLLVLLAQWYFREGDVPFNEKSKHHRSVEHVSSALRENAWDLPIDFKRK